MLDGLVIYVVWEDYRNDHQDIYFSRSTDGGEVWSTNTQVSDASLTLNTDPHIAVDAGGTIYVVWRNVSSSTRGIYFARSTDNGVTWSTSQKIKDLPTLSVFFSPIALDTDDNNELDLVVDTRAGNEGLLHMVWTAQVGYEYEIVGLRYASSSDGGNTWSATRRVTTDKVGFEYRVESLGLAFYRDNLYVPYENSFGDRDIYMAKRYAGTDEWVARGGVTISDEGIFWTPDVAVAQDGMVYTVFLCLEEKCGRPLQL